jgi:hypothetical protein
MVLIAAVFLMSITFAVLIWQQCIKFEKKALAAKKRQEEYIAQLELEQKTERDRIQKEMEKETAESEESGSDQDDLMDNLARA